MSERGTILWTLPDALSSAGALPMKVRTLSGSLIAKGVSGEPIDVDEGTYVVSALMPDGHEVTADAPNKVIFGKTESPQITMDDEISEVAVSSRANQVTLQMGMALASETGPAPAPDGKRIVAQHWIGSWLDEWADPRAALASGLQEKRISLSETEQTPLFTNDDHDEFLITQHISHYDEEDGAYRILRFTIVPHDQCIVCVGEEAETPMIMATIREGSNPAAIKYASMASDETNVLLNYVDSGALGAMQTVSETFINQGESAILRANVSLLRGVTGAYVMLRANAVEGLEAFLAQLADLAPKLPDTYVLQGELLARLGRHEEAARAISRATDSLCPWFRSGIVYLLERTRLYLELDDSQKASLSLSEASWRRLRRAKARLERMMPMLVGSQLFTTFDIPE